MNSAAMPEGSITGTASAPGRSESSFRSQATYTRRDFVKTFAGGLAVLWTVDLGSTAAHAQAESGSSGRSRSGQRRPAELAAWLHISADNTVTVFCGKTEVGQNVRTLVAQAVAEELPISFNSIGVVLADTRLVPWDAGTFGSRSTPDMFPQLRRAGATAREALLDLAVKQWSVERASLTISNGHVQHAGSGRKISFGELTKGEKLVLNISENVPLKPATAWTIAGTSVPKLNARDYVTGRHVYTTDIGAASRPGSSADKLREPHLPELLHARVLRPSARDATLVSLDPAAANSISGVTIVRDGDFVGAVASTEHLAAQAVAALRAEWKTKEQISDRELFSHLKATARNAPTDDTSPPSNGTLRQSYTIAYIAHAPLEPRAAVAHWENGQLTVWTGTQRPFGVRSELARAFNVDEANVRVIVPDTGSGYGGKHSGEAAIEAARFAKAVGKPVKLVWTREEEFCWAYFRPAGVIDITSTVSPEGKLTRWEHRNYNSGNAAIRALYDVPREARVEQFHQSQYPLKQGSYRGLAGTANHFARETHLDEVAHALKLDPLEFRLRNLSDARARAVLEAAAKKFGWSHHTAAAARRDGRGVGLAVGFDKGGYLGTCAEVIVDPTTRRVRVTRVVQSFECGAIVNPDHLKNQVEGSVVQGLGGALFEVIRFENGRILNPRFSQYRVPRFSDLPQIEVVLLDRKDLPSAGAGEAPLQGIAPAVGNAIFAATGVRLRGLPLVPNGIVVV
jgi:nicotinate dehydrogenase subunit B